MGMTKIKNMKELNEKINKTMKQINDTKNKECKNLKDLQKTLDSKIKNLNNDKISKEKEIKDEEERLKKLVDNCKKNIDKISKDSNKIKLDLTNNNKYLDTTPRKMKIYIIDVYKKNIEECKEKIKINKSIESKLKATIDKGNQEIYYY